VLYGNPHSLSTHLSNLQGGWWMNFSGHIAQRRACTYWQDPSSLPVAYVGQRAPRNCHAHSTALTTHAARVIIPTHSHTSLSFTVQVYSGAQVLKPGPMIRNRPVCCFTHGVTICRQPCPRRHMDLSFMAQFYPCSGRSLLN
jgi:hypothetical protein